MVQCNRAVTSAAIFNISRYSIASGFQRTDFLIHADSSICFIKIDLQSAAACLLGPNRIFYLTCAIPGISFKIPFLICPKVCGIRAVSHFVIAHITVRKQIRLLRFYPGQRSVWT